MNIVDVIIILLLIVGGISGFKAGIIRNLAEFVGLFAVFILAF